MRSGGGDSIICKGQKDIPAALLLCGTILGR